MNDTLSEINQEQEEEPPGTVNYVRNSEMDKHIIQRDTCAYGRLYRFVMGTGTPKKGYLILGNLHHSGSFRSVNLV
jgi:hypothetical protein